MDKEEMLKGFVKIFVGVFLIFSFAFVLLELFSPKGDSAKFYNGQRFLFNGENGKLYVSGENCVIKWEDEMMDTNITRKNIFGLYESMIEISGKMKGKLISAPLEGCVIKVYNLEYKFFPNFSISSLATLLLGSFIISSVFTCSCMTLNFIFEKFQD
jgi:hypothetical protein